MHFVFYPKHEFGCRHVASCPHLGGASLGLLVHAADQQTEWTNSLLRQIDGLRAECSAKSGRIAELTAQVEQLQCELKAERQKQFQRKKDAPAKGESESAPPQGKKRRGAPVGHPGWYRPRPATFDRLILVSAPGTCRRCGGSVKARPDRPVYDHFQEDWIEGR